MPLMLVAVSEQGRIVAMTTRRCAAVRRLVRGRPWVRVASPMERYPVLRDSLRVRLRRGLTLAELLVALVLFDVGVLALLSVAGTVTRAVGEGGNATRASQVMEGRVETLAALRCDLVAAYGGGWREAVAGNVTEHWTVYDTAGSVIVRDTVAVHTTRGTTLHGFVTALPCGPAT